MSQLHKLSVMPTQHNLQSTVERCIGTAFVQIPTTSRYTCKSDNHCRKSISNLHYKHKHVTCTEANTIQNTASAVIVIVLSSSRSDKAVCSVRHEAMQQDKQPSTDSEFSWVHLHYCSITVAFFPLTDGITVTFVPVTVTTVAKYIALSHYHGITTISPFSAVQRGLRTVDWELVSLFHSILARHVEIGTVLFVKGKHNLHWVTLTFDLAFCSAIRWAKP